MNKENKELTEEQRSIIQQCLWDLNLTPEEFIGIIEGRVEKKWPSRAFCVARLLESVNWFKIIRVISPVVLGNLWTEARRLVRFREIKEGMDYAARILH